MKEYFFYINHFSLIIFIIQFGKSLNHSGLLVKVDSQMVQSYACTNTKDMKITICHNKPPNRKWDWSVDGVIPRREVPENLKILKRQ